MGYYSAETANQYFDYAYTLLNMQCANGSFTCTGYPGSWNDAFFTSHNSYALLVLQRATGVVVTKCDIDGDNDVDTNDLALIRPVSARCRIPAILATPTATARSPSTTCASAP